MNVRIYYGDTNLACEMMSKAEVRYFSDPQGVYIQVDANPKDPIFELRKELREGISFVSCLVPQSEKSSWGLPLGVSFCCGIPGAVIISDAWGALIKAPTWEALCSAFEQLENPESARTMRRSQYLLVDALEKQQRAEEIIKQLKSKIEEALEEKLVAMERIEELEKIIRKLQDDSASADERSLTIVEGLQAEPAVLRAELATAKKTWWQRFKERNKDVLAALSGPPW